jgi:hypothetical protein
MVLNLPLRHLRLMTNSIEHLNSSKTPGSLSSPILSSIASSDSFKLAIVTDIVIDETHPVFSSKQTDSVLIKPKHLPVNYKAADSSESQTQTIQKRKESIPNHEDKDFSFIGRARIRILGLETNSPDEKLPWAIPLDKTITQYPLLNESVMVIKVADTFYYTKPFNTFNFTGVNADFATEASNNLHGQSAKPFNVTDQNKSYLSHPDMCKEANRIGHLGQYFVINPYIRSLKPSEGDTIIESRFGQSIQFSGYSVANNQGIEFKDRSDSRLNTRDSIYRSYSHNKSLLAQSEGVRGYGNPKITIRNRQRNISIDTPQTLHPKLPPIPVITESEKNYGGQIASDINNDGSTIEISSGNLISEWSTTVYKSMFGMFTEEQPAFNPLGSTNFKFPTLDQDQIIINSDRLVFSSRFNETFHFSKKRYGVVTDGEFTVDANDQLVLTTNRLACINSPQIFLGQHSDTNEPVLLGQTTVDWLYELCNWLLNHTHWYHHVHPHPHTHPDAGRAKPVNTSDSSPTQTQLPVQQESLKKLRDALHKNLSRRVFVTGGGYAPGSNGVKPANSGVECKDSVKINTTTGDGVVGEFKGKSRREGSEEFNVTRKK